MKEQSLQPDEAGPGKARTAWTAVVLAALILFVGCSRAISPTPTVAPTTVTSPTSTPAPTFTPTLEAGEEPIAFSEGFEEGLDRWQMGADVPEDPARPGQTVAWSIEVSDEEAAEGASSAKLTLDGKQDDGTIWLARPFDIAAGEAVRVRLSFDLWSASESFNTLARVAAYAGPRSPAAEEDFDVRQAANLAAGWRRYEYTFQVPSSTESEVWVALGISVVWETDVTYYVDDVQVDILPARAGETLPEEAMLLLPESAAPIHDVSADLNGDGRAERIALTGWGGGPDQLDYDFLQMFVIGSAQSGEYAIAWQSEQLPTGRAEALGVQDVNGDGFPEVLSVQAMGANGETLYVLGWQDSEYGWLSPEGGHFDGWASFGDTGARVEDLDGDGLGEILASYGPVAALTDVYEWDGEAYAYTETLE